MLKINNLRLEINETFDKNIIAKQCAVKKGDIIDFKLIKKSVDARKKNDIHYICTVAVKLNNEEYYKKKTGFSVYTEPEIIIKKVSKSIKAPIIVGSGPAGLFAALYMVESGISPILVERGKCVEERIKAVNDFWENGKFLKSTNVQFGEGGAGTFSDGKLNTGINDENLVFIKEQFVRFGAPEEILYLAKPHIGTDNLCKVVKNIREYLIEKGAKVYFNTCLTDIKTENNKITGAILQSQNGDMDIDCDAIILAIGHSARDTFKMLKSKNIPMEKKTFSIGARIEHLQKDIGYSQYGDKYKELPPADYKLAVKTADGRGVYTFCMCPGGYVVASASEEHGVVTNGMSCFMRDGENANSAVLVTINPEDVECDDVLSGMYLQREIEQKAFTEGGSNYYAPIQTVGDFINNTNNNEFGKIKPTYKPGTSFTNIRNILPEFVADALAEGIVLMDKKLKGFANPDAILTVPETRSSSPVRIIRDANTLQSKIKGLYPCGEGAGYAGGIMSAAADGLKCAKAFITNNSLID